MEMAATVRTELALSGLFRVVGILDKKFGDVKTVEEMKPLNDFVDYKIEALTREAKSDDLVKLMPSLEKLQAASLELEDLLDFYEYEEIEKQVNSSSSEPIPKKQVIPPHLRNGLNKLLETVERVENIRQSITSKTGSTQPQADTNTPTMEMAAKVGIELALSGLFRVVSILKENFGGVKTIEEMKPLNDFVDYKIKALIREAKSDDLVQSMPLLEELQAAALELEDLLDLYEYDQIEKQVKSSSSEPIPKEKVLPKHLRNGLDKLLMIVEQVENKRKPITSKISTSKPQADTDWSRFLPSDYHQILSRAIDPVSYSSSKELYFKLCDSVLIDDGTKVFSLEKETGAKCITVCAKELFIEHSNDPNYLKWVSHPDSRFAEVAELWSVSWMQIKGIIDCEELSPNTTYKSYLIFKTTAEAYGLRAPHQEVSVKLGTQISEGKACVYPNEGGRRVSSLPAEVRVPRARADGWMELELGEFYNADGHGGDVRMKFKHVWSMHRMQGLIIEGIQVRPR